MKYLIFFILTFIISCDYKSDEEIETERHRQLVKDMNRFAYKEVDKNNLISFEFDYRDKQQKIENKNIIPSSEFVSVYSIYYNLLEEMVFCESFKKESEPKIKSGTWYQFYEGMRIKCLIINDIYQNNKDVFLDFLNLKKGKYYFFSLIWDYSGEITEGTEIKPVGLFSSKISCKKHSDKFLRSGKYLVGRCKEYFEEFSKLERYEKTNQEILNEKKKNVSKTEDDLNLKASKQELNNRVKNKKSVMEILNEIEVEK